MSSKRIISVWEDTETLPMSKVPRKSNMLERRPLQLIDSNIQHLSIPSKSSASLVYDQDSQPEFIIEESDNDVTNVIDQTIVPISGASQSTSESGTLNVDDYKAN